MGYRLSLKAELVSLLQLAADDFENYIIYGVQSKSRGRRLICVEAFFLKPAFTVPASVV